MFVQNLYVFTQDSEETKNTNEAEDYFCGFWNEAESYWSDEGCSLSSINNELVTCHCNHLTNFATLFVSGIHFQQSYDKITQKFYKHSNNIENCCLVLKLFHSAGTTVTWTIIFC